MKTRSTTHRDFTREFSSWADFVDSAADDSLYAWRKSGQRSSHDSEFDRRSGGWFATASFASALDMALRRGWPEGREMLSESLALVSPRPETYPSIEFSVAGAFPCVPMFVAGDPECMVMDPAATLKAARPIVRIDYNHWISAYVTPKDMMLRGAAVVSLADQLERRDFSTELRIVGNSAANGKAFRYSIVYKRAGEPLDFDRAAFAIAHPSSMRRLAFAILEQIPELERDFKFGYGYPMHEPNDPTSGLPGGAIFVPGSQGRETPASANRAVADAAKELLRELEPGDD